MFKNKYKRVVNKIKEIMQCKNQIEQGRINTFENLYKKAVSEMKATVEYKEQTKKQILSKCIQDHNLNDYIMKEEVKRPFIKWVTLVTATVGILFVIVIGKSLISFGDNTRATKGKMSRNPYTYFYDYIKQDLSELPLNGYEHKFTQIKDYIEAASKFDLIGMGGKLSEEDYGNDFCPIIDENNNVTFSRMADERVETDESKMNNALWFGGSKTLELLGLLCNLPEHHYHSLSCDYSKTNGIIDAYKAGLCIYSNCGLTLFVMNNLEWIMDEDMKGFAATLDQDGEVSKINGVNVNIKYLYQRRIYTPIHSLDSKEQEEHYKYFACFELKNKKYILSFNSNYTVKGKNKGVLAGLLSVSQEQCRNAFCDILDKVLKLLG